MDKDRNTVIRDYRNEDFPLLRELWQETGLDSPERGDDAGTIERCIRQGGKLLVMTNPENTVLIGSSWMTFDGRRIHLHHFAIKPAYQRQGCGTRLIIATLHYIREKGYQVKLEVHKENAVAKKLYEKFGFFAFRDYDIYMIRDTGGIALPGD